MTKAELIARLGENKDTPFYKSTYNVEEVIELLNNMGEIGDENSNKVESLSVFSFLTEAMDYIEEHIAEELPPFSILGEDTREWIKDHIKEYMDEYYDQESRNDLIKHTEFGEDCLDTDNAEFEIDYGNQISVDKNSICIDDYEVKRQLEDLVTELVDSSLDAVEHFCSDIDSIERRRKEKAEKEAEAERLRKEQELQDLQREAEAEMKSEAEVEAEAEKSDEEQVDETDDTEEDNTEN